jgi:hypothetical protein
LDRRTSRLVMAIALVGTIALVAVVWFLNGYAG